MPDMCSRGSNVYFAAVKAEAERRRDAVTECILLLCCNGDLEMNDRNKLLLDGEQGLYHHYLYQ